MGLLSRIIELEKRVSELEKQFEDAKEPDGYGFGALENYTAQTRTLTIDGFEKLIDSKIEDVAHKRFSADREIMRSLHEAAIKPVSKRLEKCQSGQKYPEGKDRSDPDLQQSDL